MKIFHITASYKPAYIYGGPIQSVGKLCEELCENKAQGVKRNDQEAKIQDAIEVFTTTANGKEELNVETGKQQNVDGVPVTYFKRWTKDHSHFSPGLLIHLRSAIICCAQDNKLVIHIHAWWNLVSVLSCLVAKWYKVPVVLSPRGMLTSYTQGNRNSLSKKILHIIIGKSLLKYVHVHATSEQEKNDVLHIVQPKSITIIPNLVDVPGAESTKLKVKRTDHVSTFKLLFLSRIEEKKGLELLFEALASVNFNFHLTIAGSGDENYIKSLKLKAESLKLGERINWIGQVGNEEKFSVMANHDLLVLPSHSENFANVVIESLSVGTPVLVSQHVGLVDYVKANELGWICSLEPEDIAEKITDAYKAVAKRKTIAHLAPKIIAKDFSDETLAEKYMELYRGILNKNVE
ncbi:MAG: glycosyltransferase [Pedobacter sp.]|nr:MAG: glycosyltransferase [Pedobacter sp.]